MEISSVTSYYCFIVFHHHRANLETKRKPLDQVDPLTKPGKPT